jgi:hypothetical protein
VYSWWSRGDAHTLDQSDPARALLLLLRRVDDPHASGEVRDNEDRE